MRVRESMQAIQALGRGRTGRTDRQLNGRSEKVPIVVPDIPVIHRLFPAFFASPTRMRGAWCSCDRDGGPGLPKSWQQQEGAAGDLRSDLRRQAVGRTFGFFSGPVGKRRRKRKLPLARRGFQQLLGGVGSEAGRKSGYPKKGRGTSDGFGFGQAGRLETEANPRAAH